MLAWVVGAFAALMITFGPYEIGRGMEGRIAEYEHATAMLFLHQADLLCLSICLERRVRGGGQICN